MTPRGPLFTKRAERRRAPLWVWPVLAGAVGLGAVLLLVRVRQPAWWPGRVWPGDVDSASAVAQTVAASTVTVTVMVFSLNVVAMQLASQQFSPRLLREFTRDPVTRRVLSVLVATFVMAVTLVRELHGDAPVPGIAVLAVFVMGMASLAAVLALITHIVRVLRVDTLMLAVHDDTDAAIRAFYPSYDDPRPVAPGADTIPTGDHHLVTATRSGFVRLVDVATLVQQARSADAVVRVLVRPGDHVVRHTPVAQTWCRSGGPGPADLDDAVRRAVVIGYERTLEQDAAYGFRQLEDVAVKALSPGINDPVTAAHAVGHMGDLLARLVGCRLGPTVHVDSDDVGRAVVPDRDLAYYLDLACGQVRRFAAAEPTVLAALLRMLRDVAVSARDDDQREGIRHQAELVVDAAADSLLPQERAFVADLADRVESVLKGDVLRAYSDEAGQTRSL